MDVSTYGKPAPYGRCSTEDLERNACHEGEEVYAPQQMDSVLQSVDPLYEIHMTDEEQRSQGEDEKITTSIKTSVEPDTVTFPQVDPRAVRARSSAQHNGTNPSSLIRRLMVPAHRFSPLRKHWGEIVQPLVEHMKLLVRMNLKRRCVELKMSDQTPEVAYLQKGADFVRSFLLGFDIQDGLALLRLDDLFLESFEIKDVKRLVGDNLSRCIGRISGKEGKTKFAIENATRTRIVLADSHIHILGAFQNIKVARDSICALILGSPAGKVYNRLRTVSRRLQERL